MISRRRLEKANRIARKTFIHYHGDDISQAFLADPNATFGLYRKTKRPCSCAMCGNPRKYHNEKTRQEIKSDISFKEQLPP